jgi:hypothetical protein
MWIRCLEYLFQLAIKIQQEGGDPNAPFTSAACQLAKSRIQVTFFHKHQVPAFKCET